MAADAMVGEAFAPANGLSICHEVFGPDDGRPLILVMGHGAQMIHWDGRFCEALGERGFRVVRFDNRDAGRTTWLDALPAPSPMSIWSASLSGLPVPAPYSLHDMAQDVFGLMDSLGFDAAHIVGASMGGMIGQEMAIARPDRVLTLTSIMSTTGDPALPPPQAAVSAALMRSAPTDRAAYIESSINLARLLRGSSEQQDAKADAARAARAFDRGINPAGRSRQLAAMVVSGNRKPALRSLRVPTLVIHGEADPLISLAAGVDTAEAIPGARLLVIEGMGHSLPEPAWPRMIDAIDRHAR